MSLSDFVRSVDHSFVLLCYRDLRSNRNGKGVITLARFSLLLNPPLQAPVFIVGHLKAILDFAEALEVFVTWRNLNIDHRYGALAENDIYTSFDKWWYLPSIKGASAWRHFLFRGQKAFKLMELICLSVSSGLRKMILFYALYFFWSLSRVSWNLFFVSEEVNIYW